MAIALQVGWHGANSSSEAPRFPADRKRRWSEDTEKMLQLMTGQFKRRSETLDLLDVPPATAHMVLELESEKPLPCGWEKCLDLKTGTVYYLNSSSGKKTFGDPREVSQLYGMRQSVAESMKLTNVESFPRGDCMQTESAINYSSCKPLQVIELAQKCFTQVVAASISEESLIEISGKPLEREEAQLIDAFEKKDENESPVLVDESFADSSLELKLNLEPSSILPKEGKEAALNSLTSPMSDRVLRKSSQEITATSDAFQLASGQAEPRTPARAASSSSSSAQSLWSSLTRADNRSQSREDGGSRSTSSSEAHESKKTERAGDQSLAIVGCANCLMYVMLYKTDPKCPKCGNSVLLDFPNNSACSSKKTRLT